MTAVMKAANMENKIKDCRATVWSIQEGLLRSPKSFGFIDALMIECVLYSIEKKQKAICFIDNL